MAVPATRLLVLAIVRIAAPVHGYDVRRELVSWRADDWANIKPGSVYGALKTLQRDGLIEVVGVEQDGLRPERTQYRLTLEGEKEFAGMLSEALWSAETPKHPYHPAISLFPFAKKEEVLAAMRSRIPRFEAEIAQLQHHVKQILEGHGDPAAGAIPYHVADSMQLGIAHVEADLAWTKTTIGRIERGELDVWGGSR